MGYLYSENSYLQEHESLVESCEQQPDGKYHLILKETILFPEGGGQPSDHGKVNECSVTHSLKKNGKVVHIVNEPFEPGASVKIQLDWERRFDHMQQHSGQHLLSAVCAKYFGLNTTAWTLGPKLCQVELDTATLVPEQLAAIENNVNSWIRKGCSLSFHHYSPDSPEMNQVKQRLEIPQSGDDHLIRVVEIQGLDLNPCCGTHVSNLGDLQAIKLLYSEKGKKNKTNLYFVVGGRLLHQLGNYVARERGLNTILKCGPEEHLTLAKKLQSNLKLSQKNAQAFLRELAASEVEKYNNIIGKPLIFAHHRKEADPEYLSILSNGMNHEDKWLLLSVGEKAGHLVLCGPADKLNELGPKIMDVLKGKGSIQHGRYKAKVGDLNQLEKAKELLKTSLNKS